MLVASDDFFNYILTTGTYADVIQEILDSNMDPRLKRCIQLNTEPNDIKTPYRRTIYFCYNSKMMKLAYPGSTGDKLITRYNTEKRNAYLKDLMFATDLRVTILANVRSADIVSGFVNVKEETESAIACIIHKLSIRITNARVDELKPECLRILKLSKNIQGCSLDTESRVT